MSAYTLTQAAQDDITNIRKFTTQQWGSAQSKKYLAELRRTITLIASSPALGRERVDILPSVFSFPHASHVIYYISHQKQITVFGVLHKSMVPLNHLGNRNIHDK